MFQEATEKSQLRDQEPYHYQRNRQIMNKQPRPPQPGYQPNQLPLAQGWGGDTRTYWNGVFSSYQRRRQGGM